MLLPRNLACLLFAFSSPLSAYLPAVNPRPAIMSSVPQEFQGYIKLGVRVSSRNGALCVCVCVWACVGVVVSTRCCLRLQPQFRYDRPVCLSG